MAATALTSLALAACGGASDTQMPGAQAPSQSTQAAAAAQALQEATQTLTDQCLDAEPLAAGEPTPAATELAVDDLIGAFYRVEDRVAAESDVGDALALLEDGCASRETLQRLAVATGVDTDLVELPDPEDCDALGINADERGEGTCVAEGGPRVTVVDQGNTATTPEMEVTLLDVRRPQDPALQGEQETRADDARIMLTLEVRNLTEEEVLFEPDLQVELVLGGDRYSTEEVDTTELAPGQQRIRTAAFRVPAEAVRELDTSGNVYVYGFSDAGLEFEDAQGTVAVLRTYG